MGGAGPCLPCTEKMTPATFLGEELHCCIAKVPYSISTQFTPKRWAHPEEEPRMFLFHIYPLLHRPPQSSSKPNPKPTTENARATQVDVHGVEKRGAVCSLKLEIYGFPPLPFVCRAYALTCLAKYTLSV